MKRTKGFIVGFVVGSFLSGFGTLIFLMSSERMAQAFSEEIEARLRKMVYGESRRTSYTDEQVPDWAIVSPHKMTYGDEPFRTNPLQAKIDKDIKVEESRTESGGWIDGP